MKISIPQPCHENWQQMTPNEQGRFCASCQKTVVDFTDWTDKMLIDFLLKNKTVTCGRFTNIQLGKEFISHQPRKRLYYIAAAFSLISLFTQTPLAHAQTTQHHSEQASKTTEQKEKNATAICTVKGSVLGSKNREPEINAVIQFYKGNRCKAGCITDIDGKYEMKDLEPGVYKVVARYAGYKTISKIVRVNSHKPLAIANFKMEFEDKCLTIVTTFNGKFRIDDPSANNSYNADSAKKDKK